MTCQHCGELLPENAAFCPTCGTPTGITRQGAFASDAALRNEIAAELRNLREERERLRELRKELETIRCGGGNGDVEPQNVSEDNRQDELNSSASGAADEGTPASGDSKIESHTKSGSEIACSVIVGLWKLLWEVLTDLAMLSVFPGVILCILVISGEIDFGFYMWAPFAFVGIWLVVLRLKLILKKKLSVPLLPF